MWDGAGAVAFYSYAQKVAEIAAPAVFLAHKAALHAITYMLRARQDTPGSGVPSASEIANLQATRIARNCFAATFTMFRVADWYAQTAHVILSIRSQSVGP